MPDAQSRRSRRRAARMRVRAHRATPSLSEAIAGAAAWAAVMAASATLSILRNGWETGASVAFVAALFAVGGSLAFTPSLFLYRLAARGRSPEARFAYALLAFGLGTIGVTALVYALWYRDYYAEWHAAALTLTWAFEFVFTTIGAVYQFAVIGLRLYFPLGFAALLALALWLARKPG